MSAQEQSVESDAGHGHLPVALSDLHENAKQYSLANRALRETWGYTHSTTLAWLIEQRLVGPLDPAYHADARSAEIDAGDPTECERCEGTGDRYGRGPYAGSPIAKCPDCNGTGRVTPSEPTGVDA